MGRQLARMRGLKEMRVLAESAWAPRTGTVVDSELRVVRALWSSKGLENLPSADLDGLGYRVHRNVSLSANRRGAFLVSGSKVLVPENGLRGTPKLFYNGTNVGGIMEQQGSRVLAKISHYGPVIPRGVSVGSTAPHNWFHWIIDTLPGVMAAGRLPSAFAKYPLIVPETVLSRQNWLDALNVVRHDRECVFVSAEEMIRVQELVTVEPVTRPGPRVIDSRPRARISVLAEPLMDYANYVVAELGLNQVTPIEGRRIFLGRRAEFSRRYNQAEAFEEAQQWGFEMVFLEDLSFKDSVKIVRESEALVGPHGAGWANLLFGSTATRALFWSWDTGEVENWYHNIALVAGVQFVQLPHDALSLKSGDPRLADYRVDIRHLRNGLSSLFSK